MDKVTQTFTIFGILMAGATIFGGLLMIFEHPKAFGLLVGAQIGAHLFLIIGLASDAVDLIFERSFRG